jgi:biopolymer transport protein ExbD
VKRLGRRIRSENGAPEVNIAPLMDVVFILLIFFVVTTVFVEETGVEVERPSATSARDLEKNSLLIAVTSEGRIVYGGQEFGLNGLRSLVAREITEKQIPVIILVDKTADSGILVDVIDECKLAGAKRVSVAARREKG